MLSDDDDDESSKLWCRLTTAYQGLSIRFRRALTLLRGNTTASYRVTAKSWSTVAVAGENVCLTICLSLRLRGRIAFWYIVAAALRSFTLEKRRSIPTILLSMQASWLSHASFS